MPPHIAIFPFMSKGHTIPLLHLAHLLHHHHRTSLLTIFTTPLNSPFIRNFLSIPATVIELPFPSNLTSSIESTDQLPSMSLFHPFVKATKFLQPSFEHAIEHSPSPIDLIVSDGFLTWISDSAKKLSIPSLMFYGMGGFAMSVSAIVSTYKLVAESDEPFEITGFTGLRLTKDDLEPPFNEPNPTPGPELEFINESATAAMASVGIVVNSFYEFESIYFDRWNDEFKPKAWPVGPLCLARELAGLADQPGSVLQWLDSMLAMNRPVLYVSFGSQADIKPVQMEEIAVGLDRSGLEFLWVLRAKDSGLPDWFENRGQSSGLVVKEWVDQWAILKHKAIKGFMSHCGWNSVMESVSNGVPILAWPMMAEQRLNAVFVVQQMRMGMRVRASDGSKNGIVRGEDLESLVKDFVLGEEGKKVRERARELKAMAHDAMRENVGSSWDSLKLMIESLCMKGH